MFWMFLSLSSESCNLILVNIIFPFFKFQFLFQKWIQLRQTLPIALRLCNFNHLYLQFQQFHPSFEKNDKKKDQKRDPKGTFRLLYLKVPFSEDFSLLADQTFLSFYHNSDSSRLNDNVCESQTFLSSSHNSDSSRRMTTLVRCGC